MAKKKEKKENAKKSQPKKRTPKKYTLVQLVKESTIPDNQMILMLVDTGFYTQYINELEEANPKASWTKTEFRKQILRRE